MRKKIECAELRGEELLSLIPVIYGPKYVFEVFDESSITMLTCRGSKDWLHR